MFKKHLTKIAYIFIGCAFSACSLIPDFLGGDAAVRQQSQEKQLDISQQNTVSEAMISHMQEWQKLKPSIERLVAVESELKELIGQLNTVATQQNSPTIAQQPEVKSLQAMISETKRPAVEQPILKTIETNKFNDKLAIPAPVQVKELLSNQNSNNPKSKKSFTVQLASLSEKKVMLSTWNALLENHTSIFDKLTPIYEEIQIGGNMYLRLKATGLDSETVAKQLCLELSSKQIPCFLTSNIGSLLF